MKEWLATGWRILFFRDGPQALPGSRGWTVLAALAYVGSGLVLLALRAVPGGPFRLLALDLLFLVGFIGLLLAVVGRPARIPQSLQAVWLCGAYLHLLSMPFGPVLAAPDQAADIWVDLGITFSLAALFWSIAVIAHILKHALEWPTLRTLPLALAFVLLNLLAQYHVAPIN